MTTHMTTPSKTTATRQCARPGCFTAIAIIPGHRPRKFCSDGCKQQAYVQRLEEKRQEEEARAQQARYERDVAALRERYRDVPAQVLDAMLQLRDQHGARLMEEVGELLSKTVQANRQDQYDTLKHALEEERTKHAALLADYMQAGKKIARLENQVQRLERLKMLHTRESMLQELLLLGGRLNYACLTDLGIREGIDQWLNYVRGASDEDLARAIAHGYYQADRLALSAIEVPDQRHATTLRERISELERDLARKSEKQLHRVEKLKSRIWELERLLEDEQRAHALAQQELRRHQPAPRCLLEMTLRRWCEVTVVLYHDQPLKGEALEAFLRESSDRKLQVFIDWAESGYFADKHRQQRIALLQHHLSELEPWRGDPELVITNIDDRGYATFASGARQWLDIDTMNWYWARIVGPQGQQHVGGNVSVAPLQQYLVAHPGQSIPLKRGREVHQIVMVDDDGLAVTRDLRAIRRLHEDELDQAHAWLQCNRHDLVPQISLDDCSDDDCSDDDCSERNGR